MKPILIAIGALLAILSVSAEPISPLQALQIPIDRVIDTLRDPQYQSASQKDVQQKKIREIINGIFDFNAIARRAVGRYWKSFNPEEKKVFSDAFAELLRDSYIRKMQGDFKNEAVAYLGDETRSPAKSLVKTKIIRDTMEIPVDYSMQLRDDFWKVYDVKIEGVSLVKNYRTQFNKILFKKTPAELIEQVVKKVRNLKNKEEEAGK